MEKSRASDGFAILILNPDKVLNDKIAFGKFYDDIENFYFSSNHGSCSSEINRPKMHFLCGSKIDDLMIFTNTSDDKNYRSTCEVKYGSSFYSPKNTSEAFEIFQKYREGLFIDYSQILN